MDKHRSRPYNPLIANTFFRVGFIEAWGRGIEKIKESCCESGIPLPEYTVKHEDIMVLFKNSDQVGDQVSDQVSDQVVEDIVLNKILEFCKIERTKKEIAEHIGYKNLTYMTRTFLKPLLESGKLEYTVPEKPKSRLQKYKTM